MWLWNRIQEHRVGAAITGIAFFVIPQVIQPYWSLVSDKPMLSVLAGWLATQVAGHAAVADFVRSGMWLVGGVLVSGWVDWLSRAQVVPVPEPTSATLTIGEVSWNHFSQPGPPETDLSHVQLHASLLAAGAPITVVRFKLSCPGKPDTFMAEYHPASQANRDPYLSSAVGGSTSIAGRHERWLSCPFTLEQDEADAGWIGFIIGNNVMDYRHVRDNGMTLTAECADGSALTAQLPPPATDLA